VPVFLHYLGNLKAILARVRGRELLLHAQLAPDMMNAATQMHVCANYSLRIAFPLAGKPVPDREGGPEGGPDAYRLPPLAPFSSTDAADIEARIDAVLAALRSLVPADFAGAESRPITHSAGPAELTQPGADFLHLYGMPNFFFHLSMACKIADTFSICRAVRLANPGKHRHRRRQPARPGAGDRQGRLRQPPREAGVASLSVS